MRGKKSKKIRKYARKLQDKFPELYKDRTKVVTLKHPRFVSRTVYVTHHRQRFSGWRLAKLHARVAVEGGLL